MATENDREPLKNQFEDKTEPDDRPNSSDYGSVSTVDTSSKDEQTLTPSLVLSTALAIIGGFLFGYDTGVISGAMLALKKVYHLNYIWQSAIVSITIAGAAVTALLAGPTNDLIGRKPVIIVSSFVFAVGSLMLGFANSREMLLIGRLVVGVGIGFASMTVPMYVAECSPVAYRGKLTVLNNVFITGGQMIASITAGVFFYDEVNGWRYMLGIAAGPSLIQFVGFLFMPESPRWLIIKKRETEARSVLTRLRGSSKGVDAEIEMIRKGHEEALKASHSEEHRLSPILIQMLRHAPTRRALLVGCGLQMFQQLVGINTVMYYSATIAEMAGVHNPQTAVWDAAAVASVNFVASTMAIIFVDRLGRRKLTLWSLLGVFLSLALMAVSFHVSSATSPAVTISLPPESGVKSNCHVQTRCSDCVRHHDCGFCYSKPPHSSSLLAVNGSCLPATSDFGTHSVYGPCKAPTNATEHYWAYGYCPSAYAWLTVLGMVLFLISFSLGMGPMAWTINSEIYPTWARSTGVASATGVNWTFNLIVAMTFLSLTHALTRQGTFWLYSGISFIGLIYFFIVLPETKGKTLEEMERIFEKPWNCFCFKL